MDINDKIDLNTIINGRILDYSLLIIGFPVLFIALHKTISSRTAPTGHPCITGIPQLRPKFARLECNSMQSYQLKPWSKGHPNIAGNGQCLQSEMASENQLTDHADLRGLPWGLGGACSWGPNPRPRTRGASARARETNNSLYVPSLVHDPWYTNTLLRPQTDGSVPLRQVESRLETVAVSSMLQEQTSVKDFLKAQWLYPYCSYMN